MLNWIWAGLILVSILCAASNGRMEALTGASMESAKSAVELAIGLIGIMAFWLGLMKVAEDGGLLQSLARRIKPVMTRLFPEVPAEHPAMSAMIMNISANMLGLGNAATPFGIKAMMELDRLNSKKGVATNAMCLFLALNTSNVALFPLGVIAIRAAAGSNSPADIVFSTIFATCCSTIVAIIAAKVLSSLPKYKRQWQEAVVSSADDHKDERMEKLQAMKKELIDKKEEKENARLREPPPDWVIWGAWGMVLVFVLLLGVHVFQGTQAEGIGPTLKGVLSHWLIPALIGSLVLYGVCRGVKVYESLVEGAKEGFQVAIRIIPFLVAILVAVGMFRASGALDILITIVRPVTALLGMPEEALPMAILRPLSGSGAFGVMSEIMTTHGPDTFIGKLVSTFQGSTETTFYVLAVYFGAVQIKVIRHALPACLIADVAGIMAAVWICHLLF